MKEGAFTALFGNKYDYEQSFSCDMFEHKNIFSKGIAFNPPFEVILKIRQAVARTEVEMAPFLKVIIDKVYPSFLTYR